MNYSALYENKKRGTFDFPIELYYVDSASARYQMPLHWHLEYELILIMEGGRILESGTHEQLLESCEVYQEIYQSQFRKEDA